MWDFATNYSHENKSNHDNDRGDDRFDCDDDNDGDVNDVDDDDDGDGDNDFLTIMVNMMVMIF